MSFETLVAEGRGEDAAHPRHAPHMFLPPSRNAVIARVGRCEGSPCLVLSCLLTYDARWRICVPAPSLTHSCCLLWLVSQVHIYLPRPLGLTGKHSLLNPGPRDRLAQYYAVSLTSSALVLSCLVLSINLIHCGNEFRPAVLTAVWPCHRLAVCDSALLSTMGIRPAAV